MIAYLKAIKFIKVFEVSPAFFYLWLIFFKGTSGLATAALEIALDPAIEETLLLRVRNQVIKHVFSRSFLKRAEYWIECPYSGLSILVLYSQLLLSALSSSYFDLSMCWVGNSCR